MEYMFSDCTNFNQSFVDWYCPSLVYSDNMFQNTSMSQENIEKLKEAAQRAQESGFWSVLQQIGECTHHAGFVGGEVVEGAGAAQHEPGRRCRHGDAGQQLITRDDLAGARRFLERCEVFALAESLGGVESLNVSVASGVCLYEAVRQRRG